MRLLNSIRTPFVLLCSRAVTESHPDNDRFDLYVHPDQLKSFPALQNFAAEFKILDASKVLCCPMSCHLPCVQ